MVITTYYKEKYRPQFHFSPKKNWINDPNGLVYFDGIYHLFYQYNPYGSMWGNMHWGHAISKDLVYWEHLPIALYQDELGMIFSGSCVVDFKNSSGFFKEGQGLVAIYTNSLTTNKPNGEIQQQSIAYSEDDIGFWWDKFICNPVIPNYEFKDFRDPKVIWHEETSRWVMVLACGDRIKFYASQDLKCWDYLSEFGMNEGSLGGVFECPDLFQLQLEGDTNSKWILKVDINKGAVGGIGGLYYIGHFDGINFKNCNSPETVLRVDYGKDFYAAQSYFNLFSKRKVWIAWMNNWEYAEKLPTQGWRGNLTIPRELKLRKVNENIRLFQEPISELEKLRISKIELKNFVLNKNTSICFCDDKSRDDYKLFEIVAEFEIKDAEEFGFNFYKSYKYKTIVGYDVMRKIAFVDRRESGNTSFSRGFPIIQQGKLECSNNSIRIHVFLDVSCVEAFFNGGEVTITSLIFPKKVDCSVEVYTKCGSVNIKALSIYGLKSIW